MKTNILEYLEYWAKANPNHISYEDADKAFSYGELCDSAKRIGSRLIKENAGGGAVLVYMKKGSRNLAAFFGSLYAGGFYIPIDNKMPIDRINKIVNTVGTVAAVIYDKTTKKCLDELDTDCIRLDYEEAVLSEIDTAALDQVRRSAIDTDPAYILFTSGSTGTPKGVVVCHRSVIDYAEWLRETFELSQDTVFGNQTPFYFSMSVLDIYATLASGARLFVIPKMLFSFPVRLLETLNEKQVNTIYWVPSALSIVANLGALDFVELPYLKKILFAGEVMPTKQLNIWRKHLPDALYANLFGPTEITDIGIYYILNRDFKDDEPIPIGVPCKNVGALIVDEDGQQVREKNKIGELYIRGSFLALGYYNNPERTAMAFVQNPVNKAYPEIVYKTGDLVTINDFGELVYAGRRDFQVKHMGNRIELGEIEAAFSAIDGVNTCCCIYRAADDHIIGIYQGEAEELYIRDSLSGKLPRYMLPNVYFKLDRMPINDNGKIDRAKLNAEYGRN